MTNQPETALDVLRSVWAARQTAQGRTSADLGADCGPTKSCRNMDYVGFDGMAEPGTDLHQAWRDKLAREGKLSSAAGSIRDLVLGSGSGSASGEGPGSGSGESS